MKFLITVPGWYLGGIATFCTNLSAGLRRSQHQAMLLRGSTGPTPPPGALTDLFDGCLFVPRGISKVGRHIRRYVREIERLKPDVLVMNDSPYVMAALPFLDKAITRLPVIHSLLPWELDLGLSNPEWWDRAIGVSQSAANAIAGRGFPNRVTACLLGVPVPRTREEEIRRSGLGRLSIITVGRVVVLDKRMDRLPVIGEELLRRNIDYHWTVLGDGEYLPRLRSELRARGILERFNLRGAVPTSTVAKALDQADVLVMPSDSEGTPHALLEAMAHGVVPVVSRLAGSTTPIVADRLTGYLCAPADCAEFARAISELANNAARRHEMGHNAATAMARDFSLDAFATRFLSAVSEARSLSLRREPVPLGHVNSERGMGCLGIWRCVRTESLGRLKRWWRGRRIVKAAESGALLPSI